MLGLRKTKVILWGAYGGMFVAGALLHWVLGLEGRWAGAVVLVAGVVGGLLAVGEARRAEPLAPQERHDAIVGWGALVGGGAALACLTLPMPWGALAAAAIVGATILALRRVPPTEEPEGTVPSETSRT